MNSYYYKNFFIFLQLFRFSLLYHFVQLWNLNILIAYKSNCFFSLWIITIIWFLVDNFHMNNIHLRLGKRIREIRESLGTTQEQLAYRANISTSFLSHIERGTKKASLLTIEKLAEGLGVPIQDLFSSTKTEITYLKTGEERFAHRIEQLVREKGESYKKIILHIADYLAKETKKKKIK